MCILLGSKLPDVAHIIPFSMQRTLDKRETRKRDYRERFWNVIEMMCTEEQMPELLTAAGVVKNPAGAVMNPEQAIKKAAQGLVQRDDNLLCLNAHAHKLWTNGDFAFEPMPRKPGDEDREQIMIFHWMPTIKHNETLYYAPEEHPEHETAPGDCANSGDRNIGSERLYRWNGTQVFTHDQIIMKTDDSKRLPLPSYQLLTIQWHVQRLLHLQAAAEPKDLSDDDDSDDGYDLLVPESEYA